MRLRNKGIDRAVAKRYQPDPSKTMIIIKRLDGKTDRIYQYGGPIDFNQPVRALNRWRSQIFRYEHWPLNALLQQNTDLNF